MCVVGIGPTLDVAHTGAVILFLDEEFLVYLPSFPSDNNGEGELGVARNDVDGGLAIAGRFGGRSFDAGVWGRMEGR